MVSFVLLSRIAVVLAVLFGVAAVILWVKLDVYGLIDELSGRHAQKAMAQMRVQCRQPVMHYDSILWDTHHPMSLPEDREQEEVFQVIQNIVIVQTTERFFDSLF